MKVAALTKGITAGVAVGSVVYAYSSSKSSKKRRLKSNTAKAIHAIGDIAEGIADFIS